MGAIAGAAGHRNVAGIGATITLTLTVALAVAACGTFGRTVAGVVIALDASAGEVTSFTLWAAGSLSARSWPTSRSPFSAWRSSVAIRGVPGPRSSASGSGCSGGSPRSRWPTPPEAGVVHRRSFGAGLVEPGWARADVALATLAVAGVLYDGLSQTQLWYDTVGLTGITGGTLTLAVFLGVAVLLAFGVARLVAGSSGPAIGIAAVGAGLVPIATGYIAGHTLGAVAGHAAAAQDLDARSTGAFRALRLRQLPLAVFMVALTATTLWSLGQSIVANKPGG